MRKRYFFLILSIILCCNGFIISAQSTGYVTMTNVDEYSVINSEVTSQLIIFNTMDPLPAEAHIFTVSYDPEILSINTEKGINGVEASTVYTQLEIDSSIPGEVTIEIVYAEHINSFVLHFVSLQKGTSPIGVTAALPDIYDNQEAEIKIVDYGDVNGDSTIDIVDALRTAQKYVGMTVDPFIENAADVNCDRNITIVDALLIAQLYVGLINEFPLCNGNPTPNPTPDQTPGGTPTGAPSILPGDVNGDGDVDILDCILVQQYIAGVIPEIFFEEAADVNNDGVIDETDAEIICYPIIIYEE
jgi:hypothetical protein